MQVAFGKVISSSANKSHHWEKSGRESKYLCDSWLLHITVAMTSRAERQPG